MKKFAIAALLAGTVLVPVTEAAQVVFSSPTWRDGTYGGGEFGADILGAGSNPDFYTFCLERNEGLSFGVAYDYTTRPKPAVSPVEILTRSPKARRFCSRNSPLDPFPDIATRPEIRSPMQLAPPAVGICRTRSGLLSKSSPSMPSIPTSRWLSAHSATLRPR